MKTFIRYFYPEVHWGGSCAEQAQWAHFDCGCLSFKCDHEASSRCAKPQGWPRAVAAPRAPRPSCRGWAPAPTTRGRRGPPRPRGRAVAAPAAATAGPVDLRKCQGVSDELRKVLEEEEVSYNWRRRPKPTASPEAAPVAAAPVVAPVAAAPVAPVVVARGAGYGSAVSSRQVVPKDEPLLRSLRSPGPTVASGTVAKQRIAARGEGGSLAPKFCSKLELSEDLRAVRLVTYDGSEAMLMAGPLCSAGGPLTKNTRPPEWLLRWIEGRSSSKLFGLAADDWLKAELCMEGAGCGWEMAQEFSLGVSLKALLSGLLSDPSGEDLLASPSMAASKALHEVLAAIGEPLEDGSASLLASQVWTPPPGVPKLPRAPQVEVALNRLDPAARRGADPSSACDDRWLVQQLQSPPASPSDLRTLRRENDWLDRYLVRLMKLKRSLAGAGTSGGTLTKLLETLQQVDHYKVLGISKDASDKELRNAYRKACLRQGLAINALGDGGVYLTNSPETARNYAAGLYGSNNVAIIVVRADLGRCKGDWTASRPDTAGSWRKCFDSIYRCHGQGFRELCVKSRRVRVMRAILPNGQVRDAPLLTWSQTGGAIIVSAGLVINPLVSIAGCFGLRSGWL
eukprot:Skav219460  [mRNA]  locus=scaffold2583:95347:104782:+ [translate_table: standard]